MVGLVVVVCRVSQSFRCTWRLVASACDDTLKVRVKGETSDRKWTGTSHRDWPAFIWNSFKMIWKAAHVVVRRVFLCVGWCKRPCNSASRKYIRNIMGEAKPITEMRNVLDCDPCWHNKCYPKLQVNETTRFSDISCGNCYQQNLQWQGF